MVWGENIMKNKRGFFGLFSIMGLFLILVIMILLIIFFKKFEGIWEFLTKWWWALALFIASILWHKQIKAVINWILNKLGMKV